MDWQLLFVLMIIAIVVLLASGVWIGMAIAIAGVIGLYLHSGTTLFGGISLLSFNAINSFVLTAVPLFLFMGEIILRTGIGTRFYNSITTWLQWLPGRALHANIAGCAIFAAISGSSVVCAATIGTVAVPELTKRGYDLKMIFGSVAAGGTLGILIPPSIPMIIYSAWVDQSVAELFMAGFIPGIVLALIFMIYILIRVKLTPSLVAEERMGSSWKDKLKSLKDILPVGVLILTVLGGIYSGWATPTEVAAIAAFEALALGTAYRELNAKSIRDSLLATVRTTCMVMLIVLGAQVFSYGIVAADIHRNLLAWMISFEMNRIMFVIVVTIMYVILGCFIEGLSMVLMTLSLVYPLAIEFGFDPIWFGVYLVLQIEMALITPPVGLNLFVIHGIARGLAISEVIRGVMPYVFLFLLMTALLVIFPSLALWLPGQMR